MANYSTNEFRSGLKVLLEGEPCTILENEFVKPGKGQAFNRVKFRNLKSGRVWERTFKSGESIEAADVMEIDMEFLYADGEFWHFMKKTTPMSSWRRRKPRWESQKIGLKSKIPAK